MYELELSTNFYLLKRNENRTFENVELGFFSHSLCSEIQQKEDMNEKNLQSVLETVGSF